MSLRIETFQVTGVLLADGWHEVDLESFDLDAYEFVDGDVVLHGGGQSGISATGFSFREGTDVISGPLTAILAVKLRR